MLPATSRPDTDRKIVGTDHQKELPRTSGDDRIDAFEQPARTVSADAAVLDVAIVEQFGPLAAVGDAVAQKNDVVRPDGQCIEKAAFLVIVFVLRTNGRTGEQRRKQQNGKNVSYN